MCCILIQIQNFTEAKKQSMFTKKGKILLVDDNSGVLNSLNLFLKNKFETVTALRNPNLIPSQLEQADYDIILLDMNFTAGENTGNEGLYWLRRIVKTDPSLVVILITAYADIELAVKGIKDGATDFIVKPWDNQKLLATLQAGLQLRESRKEVNKLKSRQILINEDISKQFRLFTGRSETMRAIYATLGKVAKTDASVLITGENGTGKEIIAREIHNLSKRRGEAFVSVDLGSISETLFESEIYGHSRGAFTDAKENRVGRFESASGGTLFLDEIGNLSVSLQAKLLSVLETRKVTPVGSNRAVPFDVRLVSATNKDLPELVRNELFREDLLYRINIVQIELPPLRERVEDIISLAEFFLSEFGIKYGKENLKLNVSSTEALMNYHWPGNIRELRHTVEKAVILCDSDAIKPEDLALTKSNFNRGDLTFNISFEEAEKKIILTALTKLKWNISEVSKELNIGRQTLYRKIKKYDIR
jgi:DNA-binding NtrC family response regulator